MAIDTRDIMAGIRYELAYGSHKFSLCGRCKKHGARGGSTCIACRENDLATHCTPELAARFVAGVRVESQIRAEIESHGQ